MSNHNKFGVLFDSDGVILNTEPQYDLFWNEQGKLFHPELPNFASYLKGFSLTKTLDTYFNDNNENREIVIKRLYDFEDKMKYEYLPGSHELLQSLKSKNIPIALVTSSNDDKMKKIIRGHPEFNDFFTSIITEDKVSKTKPDPECYINGAKAINVDPTKCVVFEDSVAGIRAGKEAGCFVIGLTTTQPKEAVEKLADIVVENLSKISYEYITNCIVPNLYK